MVHWNLARLLQLTVRLCGPFRSPRSTPYSDSPRLSLRRSARNSASTHRNEAIEDSAWRTRSQYRCCCSLASAVSKSPIRDLTDPVAACGSATLRRHRVSHCVSLHTLKSRWVCTFRTAGVAAQYARCGRPQSAWPLSRGDVLTNGRGSSYSKRGPRQRSWTRPMLLIESQGFLTLLGRVLPSCHLTQLCIRAAIDCIQLRCAWRPDPPEPHRLCGGSPCFIDGDLFALVVNECSSPHAFARLGRNRSAGPDYLSPRRSSPRPESETPGAREGRGRGGRGRTCEEPTGTGRVTGGIGP